MRFFRFSAILRFVSIAAFSAAAAVVAVAVLSSPASATGHNDGDENRRTTKSWDTDNLVFSGFTARSFAVPHYSQNNSDPVRTGTRGISVLGSPATLTENHSPCQAYVIDGFFQNLASQPRNDLPVLKKPAGGAWGETDGNICDVFVTAQDAAISRAASNGGYWLDSAGVLRNGGFGTWMGATRDASAAIGYRTWAGKGSSYQLVSHRACAGISCWNVWRIQVTAPSATDEGYIARIDYGGTVGRTVGVGVPSGGFSLPTTPVRQGSIVAGSSPKVFRTAAEARHTQSRHLSDVRSVGGSHAGSWCPSGSHPRGEDAQRKIGSGTGRTLSGLSSGRTSQMRLADLFWCRSDVRYPIWYAPQSVAGTTCGTAGAPACPAGVTIPTSDFRAWGRVNCYYSALSVSASGDCEYPHPVPQCTDRGVKRDFTETELGAHTVGAAFGVAGDGSTACSTATPTQAGFEADPCITASLEIFENAAAGSDAKPGIVSSDRTLAVTAGRTAWDLDIMSAHPATASPPRDTSDASGCADGSEDRADHSVSSGGAARKQNPAPSYAASDRTDTAVPPNSAGGNIDYTGAVRNMAHRYASRIAENTCAAKRAEARLRIALLEAEAELYKDWMGRYSRWAEGRKDVFNGWRPSGCASGVIDTSPSSYSTFYAFVHAKRSKVRLDYARGMRARYAGLQTSTGTVAGTSLAKPSVSSSWCGDPSGLVSSYSGNVTALKTSSANALRVSSVTLAGVDSAYVVTPASSGTSATTAGTAAVYETVRQARTRTVTKRYMNCGLGQVPEDQWDQLPDNHLCTEYSKQETETYYVNVRGVRTSEVKATVEHSYPGYTLSVSGGGWSRSKTIAAATRTQTCGTWETSSCPSAGSHPGHSYADLLGTLPAGTEEYPDKTMVNSNFVRVMNDRQLADTQSAARHALQRLTNRDRWAWLNTGQKIFECETH